MQACKRCAGLLLTGVLLLLLGAASVKAAEIGVDVNGQAVTASSQAGDYLLAQDRLLVSAGWLESALGFGVTISGDTLELAYQGDTFALVSGSEVILINGERAVYCGVAIQKQGETFYVPLRSILEAAGFTVQWQAEGNRVLISDPDGPDGPANQTELTAWTLDVIHTNDMHSHWEHMPQQAAAVKEIESRYPDSLLLNAGDNFVGTLYFTSYAGQADQAFLNALGYDATLFGNHEFDKGNALLADYIAGLTMPVLATNVNSLEDQELGPITLPDRVEGRLADFSGEICPLAVVEVEGRKVGIIGLTTPDAVNDLNAGADVEFAPPVDAARQAVATLEDLGVQHIVALTHIGWAQDLELAGAVPGIDLIIGGHSHTAPETYPTVAGDPAAPTLVVQAGCNAERLGELHVAFDAEGRVIADKSNGQLIPTKDGSLSDPEIARLLAGYDQDLEPFKQQLAGEIAVDMPWEINDYTARETLLADLVAEAFMEAGGRHDPDAVLVNVGCTRTELLKGELHMDQVMALLPYGNELVMLEVTGGQLQEALENGVSKVEENGKRFPAVAGMRFTYDPARTAGSRITGVEIAANGGYEKLEADRTYRLLTLSYVAGGGDGYSVFAGLPATDIGIVDFNAFASYVQAHSPISIALDGRINRLAPYGPAIEALTVPAVNP